MSDASFRIMLLRGDGAGPEVIDEAAKTLDLAARLGGFAVEFVDAQIGGSAIDAHGTPIREEDIRTARTCDAILLGAVGGPAWDHLDRANRPEAGLLRLRYALGLFANLRPVKVFDALVDASPVKPEFVRGVDLLIVRELTGGLYFGKPSKQWNTSRGRRAVDTLIYREHEIERVVRLAFQLASTRRRKVTSVDKANVLSTSQLWRAIASGIASEHPEIETEHALVDSCAMRLISRPRDYDVMVMENTFGDILSDEAAVLAGSLGMLPSASLNGLKPARRGTAALQFGMYEPIHGSAPDIAGKGIANPTGAILSAAMMLRASLGRTREADAIESAVDAALKAGARTADIALGRQALSTPAFGDAVRGHLEGIVHAD
ncbi:MAG TPA: 3-isopropylmalate dehydrogenase [Thermomicrobiales bacterium]|nr:3-isopropylmalate dehydrogenase [Thermomicrobiales bacterium]